MCLTILKDQKAKVAKEDIYTLKYLNVKNNSLLSPLYDYKWKLGEEQKVVKLIKRPGITVSRINKGYYSLDVNKTLENILFNEIFLCKIPKGSRYYQDMSSVQVCSNQLIVVEQIYTASDNADWIKDGINVTRMSYKQRLAYIKHMIKSYGLNTEL